MHLYLLHFYWLSGVYIRVHLRGHYRDINIPTFPLSFNQPYHRLASPTRITDSSHRISLASFVVVLLLARLHVLLKHGYSVVETLVTGTE